MHVHARMSLQECCLCPDTKEREWERENVVLWVHVVQWSTAVGMHVVLIVLCTEWSGVFGTGLMKCRGREW